VAFCVVIFYLYVISAYDRYHPIQLTSYHSYYAYPIAPLASSIGLHQEAHTSYHATSCEHLVH
jgi:hypothetical protein